MVQCSQFYSHASHSVPLALAGQVDQGWGAVFILFDVPMARNLLHRRRHSIQYFQDPLLKHTAASFRSATVNAARPGSCSVTALLLSCSGNSQVQVPRYVVSGICCVPVHSVCSSGAAYLTFVGAILVNCIRCSRHACGLHNTMLWARSAFRQAYDQASFRGCSTRPCRNSGFRLRRRAVFSLCFTPMNTRGWPGS